MDTLKWAVIAAVAAGQPAAAQAPAQTYRVVDTAQTAFYGNSGVITAPLAPTDAFFGQDAQYAGHQPSYTLIESDTVVQDNVTGLLWTRSIDWDGATGINLQDKMTRTELDAKVAELNSTAYGSRTDWRVPTVKELYSLMQFNGVQPNPLAQTGADGRLYIDSAFDFAWGDTANGDRIIDMQVWSDTNYTSTTMANDASFLSTNFADGRIKAYPLQQPGSGTPNEFYAMFVAGNESYGGNRLQDNGDQTITDHATGLMWTQNDSAGRMDWEDALAYVQTKNAQNFLGHNDWRLPNAKELQSLVDYTRSPDATGGPAIDALFILSATEITAADMDDGDRTDTDYGFHWTGTTFLEATAAGEVRGGSAVYISFFEALGLGFPNGTDVLDVHGAGAQRSDPKAEGVRSAGDFFGPQEDYVGINNYVLLVRDIPEPSSSALLAAGGMVLCVRRRRSVRLPEF